MDKAKLPQRFAKLHQAIILMIVHVLFVIIIIMTTMRLLGSSKVVHDLENALAIGKQRHELYTMMASHSTHHTSRYTHHRIKDNGHSWSYRNSKGFITQQVWIRVPVCEIKVQQ
mmetsp:Transcript_16465/g.46781  ORF Transcript_16465/g.46781 Transcript_16465/m.46781 type:complete len:114 (-) Transcript_16465:442-783(-)